MSGKSHHLGVIFLIFLCYVSGATAIKCFSCQDEIACQRPSQSNVTKDCTDACVTIFSEFIPIKKSCVSDLTVDENQLCNDDTNPLCSKCYADNCNNVGRVDHTCIQCTNEDGNINCLRDPSNVSPTRCQAPTTDSVYCYVNVNSAGNRIDRGCMSSSREIEQCISNPNSCSVCPMDGSAVPCNTFTLPTNRRKCIMCTGSNCKNANSATSSSYCTDPNDNCVTINNYGDFKQTCASEVNSTDIEFCRINDSSCLTCNSSDCNTEFPKSPDDKDCYSCEGISCLRSSLYNTTTFCGKTDKCVALFDGFTPTKKTCYENLPTEEKLRCDNVADTSCYTCDGNKCNYLGNENHRCISCNSATDNNCLQDPTKIAATRCAAPISEDVYCFVDSSSNFTTRGCISSNRDLARCSENDSTCSVCPVDATLPCNSYPYPTDRRKCIHCSGTNCGTVAGSSLYCKSPYDNCVSINNFGVFSQNCASEITANDAKFCSQHKLSCPICKLNECNTDLPLAPNDYIECFSCAGVSCQRSTLYNETTQCGKKDSCVTLFEKFVPIKKTCYADLSSDERSLCDTTSNPTCYKCTGNRCNNLGRIDHKCITCTTSTDANCLQNPNSIVATRCSAPISDDAYCFVTSVGKTVTRGCLSTPRAINSCDSNNQQCSMCPVSSTTSCNTYVFPTGRRQCHQLRGVTLNGITTSPSKYCSDADDSCLVIKSNGTLSQICSREMNGTEIGICSKHRECCSTCSAYNNCNVKIPNAWCSSSNSHNIQVSLGVLIGLVIFLKFFG